MLKNQGFTNDIEIIQCKLVEFSQKTTLFMVKYTLKSKK